MNNASPLIQTVTPERWAGFSMDFIGAGYTGLLVKNGRAVRTLKSGRHFSFALPLLEQCQIVLVDTKLRNLDVQSHGDFLSKDRFLIDATLTVIYQVIDPKRVALELSDPIAALASAVKDCMGMAIGQFSLQQLITQGRLLLRQNLLDRVQDFYTLGFNLEDVRIGDVSFPETNGVIRQVEGMSARQEAENSAALQMRIAEAGRPIAPQAPIQQLNLISGHSPASLPASETAASFDRDLQQLTEKLAQNSLPPALNRPQLAPTILASSDRKNTAYLIYKFSGQAIGLTANPFTIGREPTNSLVLQDPQSSRYHAQIRRATDEVGKQRYQLVDCGSSNGTFVGGQRLAANEPFWLANGCEIAIGDQKWVFQDG
ncbi:FHA domain-containing protein [Lyngbya sp. CCAP 1446/10]|uniref:SPFH domain-containing protein n=1 Tax=Lyngbya sp. CCAP 1446/10 TaxID=439293 RepID=UPI0022387068|nr:SPFH domain-containing protein [Lyngbya sp. CCAP 1446/10]MCW6053893.1 FHA domain-containing protein [Lyngbya sp. CCAP 1446/10]